MTPGTSRALARCVGDVDRFVAEHWDRAPLHRAGADAHGFADLLSLDDCDRLVTTSGLRAPAFRLVKEGQTVPSSRVTRTARVGSRTVTDFVDAEAVFAEVAHGATLVLQGLQRSWPPVADLCAGLEAALAHPVQANAYLTPPTAAGLDVHADAHDVVVLHAHGRKQWVVHADDEHPWDLELGAGDVLYLPRGTRHAARTTETASLHLTVGIKPLTWRDVARRALAQAEDPELDRALPPGLAGDRERLAEAITEQLPALAKFAGETDPGALAESLQRTTRREPPARGRLTDVVTLDAIDDATRLRPPPAVTAEIVVDDDVVVRLAERQLRLPGWTAPAVRRALSGEAFTPAELGEHLDAASRLVLARRFVREGLLARAHREP